MKTNLVTIQEAKVVTSSLQISQTFSKEHRHVLEAIRNLAAENSATKSYFIESQYENRGKLYPMYIINRDGFTLLAMGFTGKKALQFKIDYINAFNQMEEYIKNSQSKDVKLYMNRKSESISAESMKRNIKIMHEQLFAHLDNMGMLFSPICQNTQSFVWDDTRSVRSNIYGFIDSYYQVVLASMRLLKEKDSDKQINEYISDKMNEMQEQLIQARRSYGERLGNSQYAFSDILIGSSWSANNSIKLNIDNLFAVFANNVVAGYYQSLKAYECDRKYKDLKFEMSKLIL